MSRAFSLRIRACAQPGVALRARARAHVWLAWGAKRGVSERGDALARVFSLLAASLFKRSRTRLSAA